ncbi:ABC transporter permease [Natronospirillum operosum]|uniref:ABC transporter permease n=1 Tax=Natronospirillum operosum TaxID=2759953 RepID=A0A4Z0W6U8_9GAMM|nr:ABC transporter permease [Natronospirillum operosum]TGG93564.1 ABC transporter permease [Natronospirillum operosum]
MQSFLLRRFGVALLTVWVTTIAVALLTRLVPGDPIEIMFAQSAGATREQMLAMQARLGLDRNVVAQYFLYLGNLLQGDFGRTIQGGQPVLPLIMQRLPNTLWLASTALVIASIAGVTLGFFAAYKKGTWVEHVLMTSTVMGISIPPFWLGLILLMVFGMQLGWFPVAGAGWHALVLPAVTLAATNAAIIGRLTRSSMLEVFEQEFMRTAWSKGLPKTTVLSRHALRAGLVPVVSAMGVQFAYMMGGAIVVEYIFSWNGMGTLAVDAILRRDYPLIQGFILVFSVVVVCISLLLDVIYAALDPRIRQGGDS